MNVVTEDDGMKHVDFTEEIDAGMEWLNSQDVRWFDKLNLDTLNVASGNRCILGQLAMTTFASQVKATAWNGYEGVLDAFSFENDWSIEHGFTVDMEEVRRQMNLDEGQCVCLSCDVDGVTNHVWEALTRQWMGRIESLRLSREASELAIEAPAREVVNAG